jgi:hypothetical protein
MINGMSLDMVIYGNVCNTVMYGYDIVILIKERSKDHRKCHLFYIYIIHKEKGGLQSTVSNE